MHNKRRFIVFAIFVICLFFLMTFAGGSGNSTPATRTVEFIDGFDNSTLSVQKIEVGEDAKVPATPKHENNVFAGWFLFDDRDTKVTDFEDITKNLKVIALYAADLNNNGIADENDEYFTVRFIDSLDNRIISEQRILVGLDATAPRVPVHEEYVFTGWSRGYTNIRANITVNALYRNADNEENVYEVTFIDGDTEEVIDIQNIEEGNAATLPEPPEHEGRVFDSWNGEYENITADTTITAIYTDDKNNDKIADDTQAHYTVTYKDYDNTDIEVFEDVLVDLATPTIEEPTREYYKFTGWYPEVAEYVTDNATYKATYVPTNDADEDGIADEEEEKYTVIYKLDANSETAYAEYTEQVNGIATPVPANPDKEYAVFGGWEPAVAEKVTKDATYIATWLEDKDNDNKADSEEAKFTVIYKLEENAEEAYAKYENQVEGIATPVPANPDKEYAVFGGWEPAVAETVTKDATYIATWLEDADNDNKADKDEAKFTVTYKLERTDEEAYAKYENQVEGIATPKPANPDKAYAVFGGWEPAVAETVTADATYIATWLEDADNDNKADKDEAKFTVTYKLERTDEEAYAKYENQVEGIATPVPANPDKEYAVFGGWEPAVAATVTNDATYFAKWLEDTDNDNKADKDEKKYTVTYKLSQSDNKAYAKYENQVEGIATPVPANPDKEYAVFGGWEPAVAETVTKDATYIATWLEDKDDDNKADKDEAKYTVIYKLDANSETVYAEYKDQVEGIATPKPANPDKDYAVFGGWEPAVAETVTANATYIATWLEDKDDDNKADKDEAKFTVTYKLERTDEEAYAKYEKQVEGIATPVPENPDKAYAVFGGWEPAINPTVTNDATYFAKWLEDKDNDNKADSEEAKFTVTYKLERTDEEAYAEYKNQVEGIATPVPANPDKAYAVFGGWEPAVAETVTANATYIATWLEDADNDNKADKDEAKFTVTYKLERTDEEAYAEYANQVEGIATPVPANPDKAYAVFGGWEPAVAEKVTTDATYIATWLEDKDDDNKADKDEAKFTVTYKLERTDEEAYVEYTNQVEGIATPVPANPDKAYAVFGGWEPALEPTVTKNATYIAKWLEDKNNDNHDDAGQTLLKVRFFGFGGDAAQIGDDQYVLPGEAAIAPTAPTVAGYRFDGWAQDFSNITADLDVYAKYTDIEAPAINATYGLYDQKDGAYRKAGIYATATDNVAVAEVRCKKGQHTADKYNDAEKMTLKDGKYQIEGLTENAIYTIFAKDTAGNISTTQVVVEGITLLDGNFEDLYATGTFEKITGPFLIGPYKRVFNVKTKSDTIKIVEARVNIGDSYKTATDFENDKALGTPIDFTDSSLTYTAETKVFERVSVYVKYEETIETSPGVYTKVPTSKVYTSFMSYLWG